MFFNADEISFQISPIMAKNNGRDYEIILAVLNIKPPHSLTRNVLE
jgi:hypothetical protein